MSRFNPIPALGHKKPWLRLYDTWTRRTLPGLYASRDAALRAARKLAGMHDHDCPSSSLRPPFGLHMPVRFLGARNGNLIDVAPVFGSRALHVRLLGVNCPETGDAGYAAQEFADAVLSEADGDLSLYLPFPAAGLDVPQLFAQPIVTGHIYLGTEGRTLSALLVDAGHGEQAKRAA